MITLKLRLFIFFNIFFSVRVGQILNEDTFTSDLTNQDSAAYSTLNAAIVAKVSVVYVFDVVDLYQKSTIYVQLIHFIFYSMLKLSFI